MPRRDRSVVNITMRLDGDSDKCQITPDLTPEELQAVGLITVQWAHLEHSLLARTFLLSESMNIDMPKDAISTSFSKRLRAFRDLAKSAPNKKEKAAIEELADHIANAEDQRHKITHGMWNWNESSPDKLIAYCFRKPFEYEQPFDLKKLNKLADRLGELLFELSFPNGFADVQPMAFPQRFPGTPVRIDFENHED